jgi:hypothetical protein
MKNKKFLILAGLSVVLPVIAMNISHALDGYGISEMASLHIEILSQSNTGTSSCGDDSSGSGTGCNCGCGNPCCNCGSSSGGGTSGGSSSGGSSSGGDTSGSCSSGVSTSSTGTLITKVCDRKSDANAQDTKKWCTIQITNYACYYDNEGNGSPM